MKKWKGTLYSIFILESVWKIILKLVRKKLQRETNNPRSN